MQPLAGIRVLELSRILAGPWCGQLLADLGAEVIKIERPGRGDDTRHWGPPFLADTAGAPTGESAYFLAANRGKRSVTIDITRPAGQDLVRRLATTSDVLIENFKVGGLARYGLDHAALRAELPGLVYCSITGFGQDGPYAHRAGYDVLIQAMGGLMSITGEADGPPLKTGVAIADLFTGVYASTAILAALRERDATGEGRHIDMALLDVQVAMLANQAANYLIGEVVPERLGNAHPNIVPYQAFATADGHLIVAAGNDDQFRRLCAVIGRTDLAGDPAYATNADRVANRERLVPALAGALATAGTAHWVGALEAAGVPCGPINHIDQVFADPQVQARGLRRDLPHPLAGQVPSVPSPIRSDGEPACADRAPPTLGADTDHVLAQCLGLDADEIARLRADGTI
ncbi:CaiB/BaiF CoA transferase family protein [Spiribacter halobius]|uniref:CoA transferase n=1 Tax=Sediminicurvatus halobius TaxID=2182432 RepID=A0A2U2N0C6_9GAMM|nr:CaiB/BaiF CoA-transferase family protein [Spiribacter halobius]PWG62518.1 CoA transferase [Spiribacter halobius]UEX78613.1 CoA transferase [Spiribacter halobius]